MLKIKKIVYIILGALAFSLGALGAILPILPTTPFLLLALFCFSKGSKRWNDWFIETKLYKRYLEEFVQKRAMTVKQKAGILLFADFMMLFPLIAIDILIVRLLLVALILFKYYYFIYKIGTIKNDSEAVDVLVKVDLYEQQNR